MARAPITFLALTLGAATAAQADIRDIQTFLTERGCNPGGIDGAWGQGSQRALDRFNTTSSYVIMRWTSPESLADIPAEAVCTDDRQLLLPTPERVDFVGGPFTVASTVLGGTDIRELGCPDCTTTPRLLAAIDFDDDGADELLVTHEAFGQDDIAVNVPNRIVVLRGDGSVFEDAVEGGLPSRVHAREAHVADFNGDGVDDLLVIAHGQDTRPFPGEQNALFLSRPGQPHLDASFSHLPERNDFSHGGGVGDLDGDGDIDAFIVTNDGDVTDYPPYALLNDGTGQFTLSEASNHIDPALTRIQGGGHNFLTARIVDVDGDGVTDLILAGSRWDRAQSFVLFGDGDGRFGDDRELVLPHGPYGDATNVNDVDAVDIDGDGDLDLVSLHLGPSEDRGGFRGLYIQVLINEGDYFRDETATRIWGQDWRDQERISISHNLFFADLDGDGDLDLIVQGLDANGDRDLARRLGLNDGTGRFLPIEMTWPTRMNRSARQLLPGDFNGDGRVDLVGYSLITRGPLAVGAFHELYENAGD
ncbi:VCBS repeat-containing protein [Hasllibacter sp. MH4015]|uniref:FG-GAP repeat domain-containing protein n=1 Tax=Hasllibacter sp. MH4015 TaxID=2854029 RepID=UPI001CD7FB23|nr:VCBS repeat-containing protein [Hasllibacter sp. MH4015]